MLMMYPALCARAYFDGVAQSGWWWWCCARTRHAVLVFIRKNRQNCAGKRQTLVTRRQYAKHTHREEDRTRARPNANSTTVVAKKPTRVAPTIRGKTRAPSAPYTHTRTQQSKSVHAAIASYSSSSAVSVYGVCVHVLRCVYISLSARASSVIVRVRFTVIEKCCVRMSV